MTRVALLLNDDFLVLLLATEHGVPDTAGDAAEAEEHEESDTGQGADDDAGDGSGTQTASGAALVGPIGANRVSITSGGGVGGGGGRGGPRGGLRGGQRGGQAAADDDGGADDAVRSSVSRGCLPVGGDDDGAGLREAGSGRALAAVGLVGALLPAGAADAAAGFLLGGLGHAVHAGRWCRGGNPVGHDDARVRHRPGRRVGAAPGAGQARGHIALERCAGLALFAAELVVGTAVGGAVPWHEKGGADIVKVVPGIWRCAHHGGGGGADPDPDQPSQPLHDPR